MQLSPRKEAVLAAVVRAYLQTGEPVGSKTLAAMLEHAPSSATLRNEMSALCALGLLCQPHTSAGRVPTGNGYRLYVNSLMHAGELAESTKEYIDMRLMGAEAEPERLFARASQILSELTGLPSFSYYEAENSVTVKRVQLVPIGGRNVMPVLVLSDGRTRSRLCCLPEGFTAAHIERFGEIVQKRLCRQSVGELNKAYLQNVIASAGLDSLVLMPLLTQLFEMVEELKNLPVLWNNTTALYGICGETGAHRLLTLSSQREPFLNLLESVNSGADILLGSDSRYEELQPISMIVSPCTLEQRTCGKIGVVGPCRMPYEQIIPSTQYIASRLSTLLCEAKKNMED